MKRGKDAARGLVKVIALPEGSSAAEADVCVLLAGVWVPVIIDAERPAVDAENLRRRIRAAVARAKRRGK